MIARLNHRRPPKMDHQELTKSSFWVGQIFMIIATVIGVYLAAVEGLNQAIKFDHLTSLEKNYHLQKSLADEYQDNLHYLTEFEQFLKSGGRYDAHKDTPQLDHFIWEAMKYSPATMETPSGILSGIRRTYSQTERTMALLQAGKIGVPYARQELEKIRSHGEADVLPRLQQSIATIQAHLQDAGVSL